MEPSDSASMRPPLNAGENSTPCAGTIAKIIGFNEAPAERGGKRRSVRLVRRRLRRFNEAPAERGGKRPTWAELAGSDVVLQ